MEKSYGIGAAVAMLFFIIAARSVLYQLHSEPAHVKRDGSSDSRDRRKSRRSGLQDGIAFAALPHSELQQRQETLKTMDVRALRALVKAQGISLKDLPKASRRQKSPIIEAILKSTRPARQASPSLPFSSTGAASSAPV